MSQITKMPVTSAGEDNKPGLMNRRPAGKTLHNGLSGAHKKDLFMNPKKPVARNGPTTTAAAQCLKRSATDTLSGTIHQPKVSKVEKKIVMTTKISPYDYKARFNNLVDKHKKLLSDLEDLKKNHTFRSDNYESTKDAAQNILNERDRLKEVLLKTVSDFNKKTTELNKIKANLKIQKVVNKNLQRKVVLLEEITNNLKLKIDELDEVEVDFTELHKYLKESKALRELTDQLATYKSKTEMLRNTLDAMRKEQKELRNTIQNLKGNIRVFCRIRPPLESEKNKPLFNFNVLDACTIKIEKIDFTNPVKNGKSLHTFTFDGIFTPYSSQEDVFEEVSTMVQSALDGYNVCIFAYGQTGSGKTYTMEGGCGAEQYGIIPRAFEMIFTYMEELKCIGWQLTVTVSFLEIYNEVIYDLLNSSKDHQTYEIKMVNYKGTDLYVSNLKEEVVKGLHDFIRLMMIAKSNRQTASTFNNECSSRSHSVAQIKISAVHEQRKEKYTSNLNLVDLAGSESGRTTQKINEVKYINKSLCELSKVILALQTNQSHISYRNSKLTHLLMPSLGGNSKILMMVNVCQFDESFSETLNSLRFAAKVNKCRVVKKNITMMD